MTTDKQSGTRRHDLADNIGESAVPPSPKQENGHVSRQGSQWAAPATPDVDAIWEIARISQERRAQSWRHTGGPFIIGALVLLVDQLTKAWVLASIGDEQEGPSWFNGNLSIIHVNNNGAAFGLLAGQLFLFVLIALVVIAVIIAYYRFLPRERLSLRISLGLQLGGALGNLLDRLHHGYVVDFVEVRTLPVFNVADAAIVTGVLILAYYLLFQVDRGVRPHGHSSSRSTTTPDTSPTDHATEHSTMGLSEGEQGRRPSPW